MTRAIPLPAAITLVALGLILLSAIIMTIAALCASGWR